MLLIGWTLCVLALLAGVSFGWIGASVGADGTLHEPFWLVPTAWALGVAGVLCLLVGYRRAAARKRKP